MFDFFLLLSFYLWQFLLVPFHRFLHIPAIYPYIHKHHHRQCQPFRGTFDGINTHPVEFIFGEFLHLFAIYLVGRLLPTVHFCGGIMFLLLGGIMASLNHTRFAVRIPGVFDVRDHDFHHRFPRSNYGQFVMWFDVIIGSYVNPATRGRGAASRKRAM